VCLVAAARERRDCRSALGGMAVGLFN
jgi:hypothetical protein